MNNSTTILTVNPNMVILAREARGFTQQELAEKISLHGANMSRLEAGDTNISEETIQAIAKATGYPPAFFTQPGESLSPNLSYRKRENVPAKLLTPIEAQMNIIRRNVQWVSRELKAAPPTIPVLEVTAQNTPFRIAELVRKQWKIEKGPVQNLTQVIEQNGIIISSFDFKTERVDSKNMLTDDKLPIIFYNRTLPGDRLRYSLSYELAQLIMHTFVRVPADRDISREANHFAASLLMPEKEIRKDLEGNITLALLGELKRKWKVSMISLLYRADDLGLLTPNQKRYLIQQFNQAKIRRREPVELDIPQEKPALLPNLMKKYMAKHKIDIKGLSARLAIPKEDYLNYYDNC